MIYKYPDYYKEFNCIGGKCEATCCAGWEIVVDEESLEKYDDVKGEFGKRLRNSINYTEEVFLQDDKKRCAFLNSEDLCDIYTNIGEEFLCHTCCNYPRHLEEFEEINEMSLSISCPVVTKLILDRVEPLTFYDEEVEEEFEDFDMLFFDILYDVRDKVISVLQNRKLDQKVGFSQILKVLFQMQEYIDRDDIFQIDELMESLQVPCELEEVDGHDIEQKRKERILSYIQGLNKLESLNPDWPMQLSQYREKLDSMNQCEYNSSFNEFHKTCNIEIELEQLMVYFVYSYFCGGVYDGDVLSKYLIAFVNVSIIEELWHLQWCINENQLSRAEMCKITYTYAREIEHSDLNLDILEDLYNKEKNYDITEMLELLSN